MQKGKNGLAAPKPGSEIDKLNLHSLLLADEPHIFLRLRCVYSLHIFRKRKTTTNQRQRFRFYKFLCILFSLVDALVRVCDNGCYFSLRQILSSSLHLNWLTCDRHNCHYFQALCCVKGRDITKKFIFKSEKACLFATHIKQTRFSTTQFVCVHYYCDKLYAEEQEGRNEISTCTATPQAAVSTKNITYILYTHANSVW